MTKIDIAKLAQVRHIITHENCPDGIASAMILRDCLPEAEVTFCQYGTALHRSIPALPGQLWCDFSPALDRVQEFLDVGAVVLDHHAGPAKTATLEFESRGLGAWGHEPGVSGAMLAFTECWVPLKRGADNQAVEACLLSHATLAGIRDTWQIDHPDWLRACYQASALLFWPWDQISSATVDLDLGAVLYEKHLAAARKCVTNAHRFVSARGTRVQIFEGIAMTSDAAELAGDSQDLTVGFGFTVEGGAPKVIFSTRSRGDFHCRHFATAYGGGGHDKAAGFSLPLTALDLNPYTLLQNLLEQFEKVEQS